MPMPDFYNRLRTSLRWRREGLNSPAPTETAMTLTRKRIYIIPTMYGFGVVVLVLALLIGALNYQINLFYFLAFMTMGIAHSILLRSFLNLNTIHIEILPTSPVFKGETAFFRLRIQKHQNRGCLQLHVGALGQDEQADLLELPAGQTAQLLVPVKAERRGTLQLPRCKISSTAPMGWFHCWGYAELFGQTLIYPQPEIAAPPLPVQIGAEFNGNQTIRGSEEISGLRPYQIGDVAHHIAWKQSARSEQLSSKLLEAPAGEQLILSWDNLLQLDPELRLSRLCAWILAAEQQGLLYALHLPGCHLGPGGGIGHRDACLARLALFNMDMS